MGAILSWLVGNPLMILAVIAAIVGTSVFSDVRAWWRERDAVAGAVKPWVVAVAERDRAAAEKEEIINEAINAKVQAELHIAELQAAFETEEINRKLAGVAECYWTDDDIRVLNTGKPRAKPPTP